MMEIIRGKKRKKIDYDTLFRILPEEYEHKPIEKVIATFDTETDPFKEGRIVKPFTCGFYVPSYDFYIDFWGDDCIDQFFVWLAKVTGPNEIFEGLEFLILVHNGGNFDFYFCLKYFDKGQKPFIINGRLVRVTMQGQEFRDSYAMIPVALGEYDKIEIDYTIMERETREAHKEEIRAYQKRDCIALAELVVSWYEMFGNKLTMASAALPMLHSHHGYERLSERFDRELRAYYFGGRNQCFETGVIHGNFKVYDIKSSYPDRMKHDIHPISCMPRYDTKITDKTHFAHITAFSDGALPIRDKSGGLIFPVGVNDFYACIHEINAGIETGTLRIKKVHSTIYFDEYSNFADFIDTFFALRSQASEAGDKIRTLFYKLVMNSSYGKFAQDPRKYENWLFMPDEIPEPAYCDSCYSFVSKNEEKPACRSCDVTGETSPWGWYLHTQKDGVEIYAAPQKLRNQSFFNVATAASITSAARASLLRGIAAAERPIYCDTDSLICLSLSERFGVKLGSKELGSWNHEASGNMIAIAGKKLYTVFQDGNVIKKASKGVKLDGEEILRVCQGETIEYANPVPKFKIDGTASFVTRKIAKTG